MKPPVPPSPAPAPGAPVQTSAPKGTRWLLFGCGALIALLLVICATVALTLWWIQRPIKPVVLSAAEKAAVEEKLRRLGGNNAPAPAPTAGSTTAPAPAPNRLAEAESSPPPAPVEGSAFPELDRPYVPGSKVLRLTEREINGLLNANTDLGKSVRLELGRDAINAYIAVPVPEDFPIGGGKMFRARGRFRVSLGDRGAPFAILEDVTVFGLSLPKAWLGGIKGENLLGEAMTGTNGSPLLKGIKSLRVEPGALVLEVTD